MLALVLCLPAAGSSAGQAAISTRRAAPAGGASPRAAHARAQQRSYIRVNQLGYEPAAQKRGYLMSSRSLGAARFLVRGAGGAIALREAVGPALGSWSGRFSHVYALEFGALRTPGSYTLELEGEPGVSSPPFVVGEAGELFSPALRNALSFYENERDGPEYIPSALRSAPAHLNDDAAMTYATPAVNGEGALKGELQALGETIDAAGGWWDAGDYLKFVETASYVVDLQLAGVRDFPAQLGATAGGSSFTAEARFGVEWLLRMWDDQTRTLYYQVGIASGNAQTVGDHDIWRLPQEDDGYGGQDPLYRFIRHRPVFRAGPPGSPVSPNLAGRLAAAFAMCFQVFAGAQPQLADRCLLAGEHVYALADLQPQGRLLTALPFSFYPETEWRDDLELGASELAIALQSAAGLPQGLPHEEASYYLRQAAAFARSYVEHSGAGEGLNLYDVSGLADFELVRALRVGGEPEGLAIDEQQLLAALAQKLEQALAAGAGAHEPFGFGFPWSESDSVSHGDGLAVIAAEYDELTDSSGYRTLGERWLGNVLGANAWGSSFIIGDGSTFPHCPQHQVANLAGSLDGAPPVLAGGVVEGPSRERSSGSLPGMRRCPAGAGNTFARFDNAARYEDNVQAYTNTEPAIDLTASSLLAFAWQLEPASPLPGERLAATSAGGL